MPLPLLSPCRRRFCRRRRRQVAILLPPFAVAICRCRHFIFFAVIYRPAARVRLCPVVILPSICLPCPSLPQRPPGPARPPGPHRAQAGPSDARPSSPDRPGQPDQARRQVAASRCCCPAPGAIRPPPPFVQADQLQARSNQPAPARLSADQAPGQLPLQAPMPLFWVVRLTRRLPGPDQPPALLLTLACFCVPSSGLSGSSGQVVWLGLAVGQARRQAPGCRQAALPFSRPCARQVRPSSSEPIRAPLASLLLVVVRLALCASQPAQFAPFAVAVSQTVRLLLSFCQLPFSLSAFGCPGAAPPGQRQLFVNRSAVNRLSASSRPFAVLLVSISFVTEPPFCWRRRRAVRLICSRCRRRLPPGICSCRRAFALLHADLPFVAVAIRCRRRRQSRLLLPLRRPARRFRLLLLSIRPSVVICRQLTAVTTSALLLSPSSYQADQPLYRCCSGPSPSRRSSFVSRPAHQLQATPLSKLIRVVVVRQGPGQVPGRRLALPARQACSGRQALSSSARPSSSFALLAPGQAQRPGQALPGARRRARSSGCRLAFALAPGTGQLPSGRQAPGVRSSSSSVGSSQALSGFAQAPWLAQACICRHLPRIRHHQSHQVQAVNPDQLAAAPAHSLPLLFSAFLSFAICPFSSPISPISSLAPPSVNLLLIQPSLPPFFFFPLSPFIRLIVALFAFPIPCPSSSSIGPSLVIRAQAPGIGSLPGAFPVSLAFSSSFVRVHARPSFRSSSSGSPVPGRRPSGLPVLPSGFPGQVRLQACQT